MTMKKLLLLLIFSSSTCCVFSQFHIGDSTAQVMLDVIQYKNCSEPRLLANSVYWEDFNLDLECFAFYNTNKHIYKFVIVAHTKESFSLLIKSFDKDYMRNRAGEWFASVNEKAYLIKAQYNPDENINKYVITFTKL